jgi:hypothetical protein
MIDKLLKEHSESELIASLKKIHLTKIHLSESDRMKLKEYETSDYILLGIIGLILHNKPRIFLGKKQVYDKEIHEMCSQYPLTKSDLAHIADQFLEDDFSEESEFILRKVMLEYPYKKE